MHKPNVPNALVIREAKEQDEPAIERLAAEAGMSLTPRGRSFAAEQGENIVGFIRIVQGSGRTYVNPVVVDPRARRQGIGRALMEFARNRYGTLHFVARGHAVAFYQSLGCTKVSWSCITPEVGEDCDACPNVETCKPVPMAFE